MIKTVPAATLLDIFDDRVLAYQQQLARCQFVCSEDAVHDLRVSIRRLLALVEVLCVVFPELPRCRGLRRRLKNRLDSLSALRDIQVMLEAVRAWPMSRAGQAYALWLQQHEKLQLATVSSSLRTRRDGKVRRRLDRLRGRLETLSDVPGWQYALQQATTDAFTRVMARHRRIVRDDVQGIHRMRVAFKRFRYTVEVGQALVSSGDHRWLKALRDWQTLLGHLQDTVVMSTTLAVFIAEQHQFDVTPLVRLVTSQREKCLQDYWQQHDDLSGLWPPAS